MNFFLSARFWLKFCNFACLMPVFWLKKWSFLARFFGFKIEPVWRILYTVVGEVQCRPPCAPATVRLTDLTREASYQVSLWPVVGEVQCRPPCTSATVRLTDLTREAGYQVVGEVQYRSPCAPATGGPIVLIREAG